MLNRINSILVIGLVSFILRVVAAQVSDTTGDDNSNAADKIISKKCFKRIC